MDFYALELKVWRDGRPDPLREGLEQLGQYLERLRLDHGTLVLFDGRSQAPSISERCSKQELDHEERRITVVRL
jgi:hypothetical protein